jgi:hypothetical protein
MVNVGGESCKHLWPMAQQAPKFGDVSQQQQHVTGETASKAFWVDKRVCKIESVAVLMLSTLVEACHSIFNFFDLSKMLPTRN